MVKRSIIYLLGLVALTSCYDGIKLDIQNVGGQPGTFIECYCQVGELYNLTATYLSPIDEVQHLDYSYNFTAYITDSERHKLNRALFQIGNYIYSHGSPKRLSHDFKGDLKLEIISPKGEVFTAISAVPDPVEIVEVKHIGENFIVHFDTSQDEKQNYFAVSMMLRDKDGKIVQGKVLLVNPQGGKRELVSMHYDKDDEFHTVDIALKRLTKDGYIYQYSILENQESGRSNIVAGVPLRGNIEGANGVFTCYTKSQVQLTGFYDKIGE